MNGNKILKSIISKILALILFLGCWYLIYFLMNRPVIFPSPTAVIKDFINILFSGEAWWPLLNTFIRVLFSFVIAFLLGIILGFIAFSSKLLYSIFKPYLLVIRSTPLLVLILLAIIWFKQDLVPIFATFLVVFPIIFSNVLEGLKSVDNQLLEMTKLYNFEKKDVISNIYLPHLTPFLFSAISTGLGIAWKAVVAAEIIVMSVPSLGEIIHRGKLEIDSIKIFSWTIVIILFSAFTDLVVKVFFNLTSWNRSRND